MTELRDPEPNASRSLSGIANSRNDPFPELMARRVEEILLVASAYDAFTLEEDGLLTELIYEEYVHLGLSNAPRVTRAATGEEALRLIVAQPFDLVITMFHLGDMGLERLLRTARAHRPEMPIVLLIPNEAELARLGAERDKLDVDSIYVWRGNTKIFLAIVKALEDRWNVEHDTRVGGVGVLILVEDSIRYRSLLLPLLYAELVTQTRSVMREGVNHAQRRLRMRARPKVLCAETYEDAIALYTAHRDNIFGVITDVAFARGDGVDPAAGIDLIREIKADNPDVPALLQSSDADNRVLAEGLGAAFLHKRSRTLMHDVRAFMLQNFGFGDFVFRRPDQREMGRASDLQSMVRVLAHVPAESLDYHASRHHFSNWLRARTEFALARRLRARKREEFADAEVLREFLIQEFQESIRRNRRGMVEEFSPRRFDAATSFVRIGGGSLGGKARGLAFLDALLARSGLDDAFPGVRIFVPRTIAIGTDVFDEFLDTNKLRGAELYQAPDDWTRRAFLKAELPPFVVEDLRAILPYLRDPLAVRSSSLLEDSPHYPFAGVFDTHMLANNAADDELRLEHLCSAIKLVYASAFFADARRYLDVTPHRVEEQKMAVVIQPIVGSRRDDVFYPSLAGAARSHNFYPFGHMTPEDGVASAVLGLGVGVVDGDEAFRFCPAYPQVFPQLADPERFLDQSQRRFVAIDVSDPNREFSTDPRAALVRLDLEAAERHGTLAPLGSVWSAEDQALYDGIYRPGVRVVTFAHVLKSDLFPLAPILAATLSLAREGLSAAAEIEFAADLHAGQNLFAILQMRPFEAAADLSPVAIDAVPAGDVLCMSDQSLGNGVITGIRNIIYVRPEAFDPAQTMRIGAEIAEVNESIRSTNDSSLLIGPGRWGSSNPTLGVPVNWGQISTARVIIETTTERFAVDPSQGSHFFHNLVSLGVSYLTINTRVGRGYVDWAWLDAQPAALQTKYIRHLRLARPIEARVDGRSSRAVVLKREISPARPTPPSL